MNSKMPTAVLTIPKTKAARKQTSSIAERGPHRDVIIIARDRVCGRQPRMADLVGKLFKQQREPGAELTRTRCDKFRKMCHDNFKSWGRWVLILAVLIAYAFLGAAMFYYIEGSKEKRIKTEKTKILDQTVRNLSSSILQLIMDPKMNSGIDENVAKLLKSKFEEFGIYPNMKPAWTMWGSLFYAATIFTTIGYGNIAPVTYIGQIMTMIYALVGIPLLLACLNDFGNILSKEDAFDDLEAHEDNDSEEFSFPIFLALLIIIGWLFACAAIFTLWEKWTYFEAFYFFFISLSTIGLGDVLPEHPARLMLCFPFVIIGLSLITLAMNLIQEKVEELKEYTEDMIEDQIYVEHRMTSLPNLTELRNK